RSPTHMTFEPPSTLWGSKSDEMFFMVCNVYQHPICTSPIYSIPFILDYSSTCWIGFKHFPRSMPGYKGLMTPGRRYHRTRDSSFPTKPTARSRNGKERR